MKPREYVKNTARLRALYGWSAPFAFDVVLARDFLIREEYKVKIAFKKEGLEGVWYLPTPYGWLEATDQGVVARHNKDVPFEMIPKPYKEFKKDEKCYAARGVFRTV